MTLIAYAIVISTLLLLCGLGGCVYSVKQRFDNTVFVVCCGIAVAIGIIGLVSVIFVYFTGINIS